MALASSEDKQRAVDKAASKGTQSLTANERFALEQAAKDSGSTGRAAANILDGRKPDESRRNFFGF